jgi:hypothetical protein
MIILGQPLSELKKKEPVLESVNTALLSTLNPDEVAVAIERAGESEMDEMWSFVRCKTNPRWLWHAIDHHTGAVLAYVFGRRKDEVFLKLKALLEPFGILRTIIRTAGVLTSVILIPSSTRSANATPRKSSASI